MRTGLIAIALLSLAVGFGFGGVARAAQEPQPMVLALATYTPPLLSSWEALASIAVLTVISAAALVYMLAGVITSPNARAWSRMQIYEGLLSMVLIAVFGAFSAMLFINPIGSFGGAASGLSGVNGVNVVPYVCNGAATMYELSTCDISTFVNTAMNYFVALYYAEWGTALVPGLNLEITPLYTSGQSQIAFGGGVPSLFPSSVISMMSTAESGLLLLIMLNQLQVLILGSSILLLSFFMVLGLVARTFGFTRTFGGAMIAFGLGLGVIYPLLVSISYGFINVQMQCGAPVPASVSLPGCLTPSGAAVGIFVLVTGLAFGAISGSSAALPPVTIIQLGYLVTGLLIVPMLNFAVLDAFIIDFSKAIGERVDFMSLLGNLV